VLQEQSCRAFLDRDVDRLGRILSDDFTVNSPINRILTKAEMLDLLGKGVIGHFSYEEEIERVTRRGELVIVMGSDAVTNTPDAPPTRRRFTNVWCAADDSWLMVARHAHHLP
jgi:hypothetical protein